VGFLLVCIMWAFNTRVFFWLGPIKLTLQIITDV